MFFKDEQTDTLKHSLGELETRLATFLQKLDERADQLLEGFTAEAPAMLAADDLYGQTYSRFLAATRGQLATLRKKVQEVRESQVEATLAQYQSAFAFGSPAYQVLYEWRERCLRKIYGWEENLYQKETAAIEKAEAKDYEPIFRQLLSNYYREAANVHCKQCGGKLTIGRVYYYSTYVACDFCHTQNIFDPGTNARQLEETARKLGEQRSKPLLDAHHAAQARERTLYHQAHELHLGMIHEKSASVIRNTQHTIDTLETERVKAQQAAPALLEQYYRAVFDEMSKLLPDLKEHNERFFRSMQTSYLQRNI